MKADHRAKAKKQQLYLYAHGQITHLEVRVRGPQEVRLGSVDEEEPQDEPAGAKEEEERNHQLRDWVDLAVKPHACTISCAVTQPWGRDQAMRFVCRSPKAHYKI